MVKSIEIKLPPLTEQKSIAKALSDTDTLITALEKLIAKKRAIKTATMQQLLTGKTRLPGFGEGKGYKDSELGRIPEDWEVVPLDEVGSFLKGRGIKKDQVGTGSLPCVRYGELYTVYNEEAFEVISKISTDVAKSSLQIKFGDVLFAGSGETVDEIGKCTAYMVSELGYAGGDIVVFRALKVNSSYLSYSMTSQTALRQKMAMGQGSSVIHIHASNLKNLLIISPSLDEQSGIAEVFRSLEGEVIQISRKLGKVKRIKTAMMQQLLTGRTRIT